MINGELESDLGPQRPACSGETVLQEDGADEVEQDRRDGGGKEDDDDEGAPLVDVSEEIDDRQRVSTEVLSGETRALEQLGFGPQAEGAQVTTVSAGEGREKRWWWWGWCCCGCVEWRKEEVIAHRRKEGSDAGLAREWNEWEKGERDRCSPGCGCGCGGVGREGRERCAAEGL